MRTVEDGRICRWQFGINEAIFRETRVIVEQCLFAGEGASDRTNPLIFQARSLAGQENISRWFHRRPAEFEAPSPKWMTCARRPAQVIPRDLSREPIRERGVRSESRCNVRRVEG
jgi:hypothetical protein